jgi:hypothetical protein
MSVLKQLAIHNFSAAFGLPVEISHEIMGFCFYDTVTAVSRATHKVNMEEIVDQFDNAYATRAALFDDLEEYWEICLVRVTRIGIENDCKLQATNCHTCGNYKFSHTFFPPEEELMIEMVTDDLRWLEAMPLCIRCCCQN